MRTFDFTVGIRFSGVDEDDALGQLEDLLIGQDYELADTWEVGPDGEQVRPGLVSP